MKELVNKIKSFANSKPCIKSSYAVSTEVYRAASDKKPALSFDSDGKIKFGFCQMCIVVVSCIALSMIYAASVSAKYKKKYNKKFEKIKKKYEKKEAKLQASAEEGTEKQ